MNGRVFPNSYKMRKNLEKTFGVATSTTNHSMTPKDRINPTEDIQALLVLASGMHHRLVGSTALTPHAPQPGMKTETRFIFKDYDLIMDTVSNQLKFFLTSFGSFLPLSARPARTHKGVALAHIPTHAVTSGHDVHESSPDGSASDTPPPQCRPTGPVRFQRPLATSGERVPRRVCRKRSIVRADQGALDLHPWPFLLDWHGEPILLRSIGTVQTILRLGLSAIPIKSKVVRQCECRPTHQGQFPPFSKALAWLHAC